MTHEDKKNLAKKHETEQINPKAADAIEKAAENKLLTCADAHKIAKNLGLSPSEMGVQIDLAENSITLCQLGMFGYKNGGKGFDPDINITEALSDKLDQAAPNGRISCKECWDIALELKMKRLDVGSACEKKQIKIKFCQLGFF